MKIDILTLFPSMFAGPFDTSMLKKAKDIGAVEINIHNLRDWAKDKHKTVDDRPYGGGAGMVIRVDVVHNAINDLQFPLYKGMKREIVLTSAKGKIFTQKKAQSFSKLDHLIIICGHYEGVDERVAKHLVDEEISIGKYVLTGGEIPAMIMIDSAVRLIPGVLGNPNSLSEESYSELKIKNCAEYPQYTRPEDFKGWKVPEVLLSGNHAEIKKWRTLKKSVKKK